MTCVKEKRTHGVATRFISAFLVFFFSFGTIIPPYIAEAQVIPLLPIPGSMVVQTPGYVPALIKGITIHPENPLLFDFIIDTGHSGIEVESQEFKDESMKLIKYFLASLTVPENEMWVNLSPVEKDRIIPESFVRTEMGINLLAQDYILKQLTASLVYPEDEIGKKFWDRVYARAQKEFGTTDVPMDSFHKVWIVPEKAFVYEKGNQAFVVSNRLKVMLEQDYLAARAAADSSSLIAHDAKNEPSAMSHELTALQTQVMREVVIPEIEKEVNEGKNFAQLRQIFQSAVLAKWFKQNFKESLLGQIYVDKKKLKGIDIDNPEVKHEIYQQYVEAFEKGVYNYIKEDFDPATEQIIPRHYFSGGTIVNIPVGTDNSPAAGRAATKHTGNVGEPRVLLTEGPEADKVAEQTKQAEEATVRKAGQAEKAEKPGDEAMLTQTVKNDAFSGTTQEKFFISTGGHAWQVELKDVRAVMTRVETKGPEDTFAGDRVAVGTRHVINLNQDYKVGSDPSQNHYVISGLNPQHLSVRIQKIGNKSYKLIIVDFSGEGTTVEWAPIERLEDVQDAIVQANVNILEKDHLYPTRPFAITDFDNIKPDAVIGNTDLRYDTRNGNIIAIGSSKYGDASGSEKSVWISITHKGKLAISEEDLKTVPANLEMAVSLYNQSKDSAMLVKATEADLRNQAPEVLDQIRAGQFNDEQIQALNTLHLIDEIGVLSEAPNVKAILDQISKRDKTYPLGVRGYMERIRAKLDVFFTGQNPMENVVSLEQPKAFDLTDSSSEIYQQMVEKGWEEVPYLVFGMPAGGLGERLGYSGLKLDIPLDSISGKSYLQMYIENMLAFQKKAGARTGQEVKIPFFMMTSENNHDRTMKFLEENNNFGMQGKTVIDVTKDKVVYDEVQQMIFVVDRFAYEKDGSFVNARDLNQIAVFTQDSVLAVKGKEGKLILDSNGLLKEKPHSHGDIELLLHLSGLAKAYQKDGKRHTVLFQDTNAEAFNAILPGLGASVENSYGVNLLAVERQVGDTFGAIAIMKLKDGQVKSGNIEYTEIAAVARQYGMKEEDFKAGNINIIVLNQDALVEVLEGTSGLMQEIVNSKEETGWEARLEASMQDIAKEIPGEQVGVTVFPVRDIFAATKNSFERAEKAVESGIFPEHLAATEGIHYMNMREKFYQAGVYVEVESETELAYRKIPYQGGARISVSPFFAQTAKEIAEKVTNMEITDRSFLHIEGENVFIKNVILDGALVIKIRPDQQLTVDLMDIENAGWEFRPLLLDQAKDESIPEHVRLRGYQLVKHDDLTIDLTDKQAGSYVYGENGLAKDEAMLSTVPLKSIKSTREVAFGTSGDRGKIGQDFDENHVTRLAEGTARWFANNRNNDILVGYDPRQGNEQFSQITAQVAAAHGINVKYIKEAPTPTPVLALLANRDSKIGGVVNFTASHNPATDGGFKFSDVHGGVADSSITDALTVSSNNASVARMIDYDVAVKKELIEEISLDDAIDSYLSNYLIPEMQQVGAWKDIVNFIVDNPDFTLILDAMNGTGGPYLEALYQRIGEEAIGSGEFFTLLHGDSDSQFSQVNHEPNPTKEKSIVDAQQAVMALNGNGMGLLVDGDSDRFGTIDSNGENITANDMIAMIAYFLNKEIGLRGAIGKTVATSNFVNAVADYLGAELDEEAVGFKHFVKNVAENKREYLVAGEESAHAAVEPFMESWDDGFVIGLMALWIRARTGKTLVEYRDEIQKTIDQKFKIQTIGIGEDDLAAFERIKDLIVETQGEVNNGVALSDRSIVKTIEAAQDQKVVDMITKDGVKLVFEDGSWMLLRPSGTQVLTKLYVETAGNYGASDAELTERFEVLKGVGEQIAGGDSAKFTQDDDDTDDLQPVDNAMLVDYRGGDVRAQVAANMINAWAAASPAFREAVKNGELTEEEIGNQVAMAALAGKTGVTVAFNELISGIEFLVEQGALKVKTADGAGNDNAMLVKYSGEDAQAEYAAQMINNWAAASAAFYEAVKNGELTEREIGNHLVMATLVPGASNEKLTLGISLLVEQGALKVRTAGGVDNAMLSNPVLPRVNPTTTGRWKNLERLLFSKKLLHLRTMFENDPRRAEKMTIELSPEFSVDFSKNRVDDVVMEDLVGLAYEAHLDEAIELMFTGAKINETENRAVLHTALRNVKRDENGKLVPANGPVYVDGKDVMPGVIAVLEQMEEFTNKLHSGEWKSASGEEITDIVNVGIGGSDLGPKMAAEALTPYKAGNVNVHFLSNVDGTAAAELMKKLNPKTTLIRGVSKTWTTQEAVQNLQTLKKWILDAYNGDHEVIKNHFVASSTAEKLVSEFGIDAQNMLEFWDWVGGRYSVWSAVGATLSDYIGFDNFLEFLQGGLEADNHFRNQPFDENIPVLKALMNVWYNNFLGAETFAILPYDQYLSLFPAFSQQFFMESNGKSVDRNGNFITDYQTGMIAWGAAGTDGQHSFYQMIHQGTKLIPADFIGVIRSHNELPGHHDKFYANFVAQTEALAFGKTQQEVIEELKKDPKYADYSEQDLKWQVAQMTFKGNKPTTSIILDQVTPRTLGNLIAMYEHQIFTEGIIQNIFSFDQMGVQLGKVVAGNDVLPFLDGSKNTEEIGSNLRESGVKAVVKFLEKRAGDNAMLTGASILADVILTIEYADKISNVYRDVVDEFPWGIAAPLLFAAARSGNASENKVNELFLMVEDMDPKIAGAILVAAALSGDITEAKVRQLWELVEGADYDIGGALLVASAFLGDENLDRALKIYESLPSMIAELEVEHAGFLIIAAAIVGDENADRVVEHYKDAESGILTLADVIVTEVDKIKSILNRDSGDSAMLVDYRGGHVLAQRAADMINAWAAASPALSEAVRRGELTEAEIASQLAMAAIEGKIEMPGTRNELTLGIEFLVEQGALKVKTADNAMLVSNILDAMNNQPGYFDKDNIQQLMIEQKNGDGDDTLRRQAMAQIGLDPNNEDHVQNFQTALNTKAGSLEAQKPADQAMVVGIDDIATKMRNNKGYFDVATLKRLSSGSGAADNNERAALSFLGIKDFTKVNLLRAAASNQLRTLAAQKQADKAMLTVDEYKRLSGTEGLESDDTAKVLSAIQEISEKRKKMSIRQADGFLTLLYGDWGMTHTSVAVRVAAAITLSQEPFVGRLHFTATEDAKIILRSSLSTKDEEKLGVRREALERLSKVDNAMLADDVAEFVQALARGRGMSWAENEEIISRITSDIMEIYFSNLNDPVDFDESKLVELSAFIEGLQGVVSAEDADDFVQGVVSSITWDMASVGAEREDVGGIDLNPEFLDLKIKRDGAGIPLPMIQQSIEEMMLIEGFLPVIINVTPIQNLPMLLGLDVEPDENDNRRDVAVQRPYMDKIDKVAKLN